MNERIQQLAEQAGFLNKDEESIGYFAELIVRECADMVSKRPYVDDGVSIYLHPSTIIKRHFGVEE